MQNYFFEIQKYMTIYDNLKNEKQYKACTGLSRASFDSLFTFFEKLYIPKIGNPYLPDKQPVLQDKREALFFVLYYLKTYPGLVNFGMCFGFAESTASDYLELLKPLLKASFKQAGIEISREFCDEKKFAELFDQVADILIDGFEIPTQRAENEVIQTSTYSGKKNSIQ